MYVYMYVCMCVYTYRADNIERDVAFYSTSIVRGQGYVEAFSWLSHVL